MIEWGNAVEFPEYNLNASLAIKYMILVIIFNNVLALLKHFSRAVEQDIINAFVLEIKALQMIAG